MNESPLWAANQGDLRGAVRILRESYGIQAHEDKSSAIEPVAPAVSFRVLFQKPYRERTIVAAVMNACIAFEYTAIAFFLPRFWRSFWARACSKPLPPHWDLMRCSPLPAACWACDWPWKFPSRHVAIAGFALQFIALISLALIGHPEATYGVVFAILLLGVWLFAEGFGPGAQLMIYPALAYPTSIRATGVGFNRLISGAGSALALFIPADIAGGLWHQPVLDRVTGRSHPHHFSCLWCALNRRATILMTRQLKENTMSEPDYTRLAERFRPVFARIADGAAARERDRTLLHEPIKLARRRALARCVSQRLMAAWGLRCRSFSFAHRAGRSRFQSASGSACPYGLCRGSPQST